MPSNANEGKFGLILSQLHCIVAVFKLLMARSIGAVQKYKKKKERRQDTVTLNSLDHSAQILLGKQEFWGSGIIQLIDYQQADPSQKYHGKQLT